MKMTPPLFIVIEATAGQTHSGVGVALTSRANRSFLFAVQDAKKSAAMTLFGAR